MKVLLTLHFLLFLFLISCSNVRTDLFKFYDDDISSVDIDSLLKDDFGFSSSSKDMQVVLDKVLYYLPSSSSRLVLQVHQITKLLQDRSNVNTFIAYKEAAEKLRGIEAFVIDKDGKRSFASDIISQNPFYNDYVKLNLYRDIRLVKISFANVSKGSTVHIRYELESDDVDYGGSFYLDSYHPVLKRKYIVILPKEKRLYYNIIKGTSFSPKITYGSRYVRYVFEKDRISPLRREDYAPSFSSIARVLRFSSIRGWDEFKSRMSFYYKERSSSAKLDSLAKDITLSKKDYLSKARLLYNYVSNKDKIKNVILPFGLGLNEFPSYPLKVIDSGYGDLKDKAYLLYSLLRSLNIRSHLAFLSLNVSLDDNIVSLRNDINGILVAIRKQDGTYLYMDPSSSLLRFSYLPSRLYGRRVFVLDNNANKSLSIKRIPLLGAKDNNIHYNLRTRLSKGGIEYSSIVIPRGDYETKERLSMLKVKYKNTFESIEENYRSIYDDELTKLRSLKTIDPEDLENVFSYKASFFRPNNKVYLGKRLFSFDPSMGIKLSLPVLKASNRVYDIEYPLPYSITLSNKISYKSSLFRLKSLISRVRYEDNFIKYSRTLRKLKRGTLFYKRTFTLKTRLIKKELYISFKEGIEKVRNKEQDRIIFIMTGK